MLKIRSANSYVECCIVIREGEGNLDSCIEILSLLDLFTIKEEILILCLAFSNILKKALWESCAKCVGRATNVIVLPFTLFLRDMFYP